MLEYLLLVPGLWRLDVLFHVLQACAAGCSRKLHRVDQKQHHVPKVQLSQVSELHLNVRGRSVDA